MLARGKFAIALPARLCRISRNPHDDGRGSKDMMRVWRGGSRSSKRSGFLAALTFFAASAFLYLNFEPAPAGADRKHRKVDITRLVTSIEAIPKPTATPVVPAPTNSPADGKKAAVAPGPSEFDRIAMLMNMVL